MEEFKRAVVSGIMEAYRSFIQEADDDRVKEPGAIQLAFDAMFLAKLSSGIAFAGASSPNDLVDVITLKIDPVNFAAFEELFDTTTGKLVQQRSLVYSLLVPPEN